MPSWWRVCCRCCLSRNIDIMSDVHFNSWCAEADLSENSWSWTPPCTLPTRCEANADVLRQAQASFYVVILPSMSSLGVFNCCK